MLPMFNINYPQTRKSCGFGTGLTIGKAVDEAALKKARNMVRASVDERLGDPAPGERRTYPFVKTNSCVLSSFTESAFFQRASGDYDQVLANDDHNLTGRVSFSTLTIMDEPYRYMKMLGLPLGKGVDGAAAAGADPAGYLTGSLVGS